MGFSLTEFRARASAALTMRVRSLAGGRFASRCGPTTISILLTERCNARCVHCDIWKNRGQEDPPSVDQWKSTLEEIRRWLGPTHVVFTGGEALLRPFAPEVVAHASRIGLLVEHLTHGYWPDQARVERIARARPWRITVSLDGVGPTHDLIRGRTHFFEATARTIDTLVRLRSAEALGYVIRLKTVIMEQNLDDVGTIARYAREHGCEVFYQPIEQNYNTPDDPRWFEHSGNWPRDPARAVAAVEGLLALKCQGFPIANSKRQLAVMIRYFRRPEALLFVTQSHTADHDRPLCSALTDLQIQANGDVKTCWVHDPIGNIKAAPIRQLWRDRPHRWESGCCMQRGVSCQETNAVDLVTLT
jgi:MoaA/NifB/PqqE/SkfB family radical SAM enzyme